MMRLSFVALSICCCLLHVANTAPASAGTNDSISFHQKDNNNNNNNVGGLMLPQTLFALEAEESNAEIYGNGTSPTVSVPSQLRAAGEGITVAPGTNVNSVKKILNEVVSTSMHPQTQGLQHIVTEHRVHDRQRLRKHRLPRPHQLARHAQRAHVISYEPSRMLLSMQEQKSLHMLPGQLQQTEKALHPAIKHEDHITHLNPLQKAVNVDVNVGNDLPAPPHNLFADASVAPTTHQHTRPVIGGPGIIERSLAIPIGILQSLQESLGSLKLPLSGH